MIFAIALSYDNGAVAAAKGNRIDVQKLIKEAGEELAQQVAAGPTKPKKHLMAHIREKLLEVGPRKNRT